MKKPFRFLLAISSVFLAVTSCIPDDRIQQTPALREQIRGLKVKRVTPNQAIMIADDWGKRIVKQAQQELTQALAKNSADGLALCQLKGLPKIDSLVDLYGVKISLLGAKDVKNAALNPKEQEVLDAYLYNAENKLPQLPNIQKLGDSVLIYNAPVATNEPICARCFGNDPTKLAVWRVKFLKHNIIQKVDEKSLLKLKKK